MKAVVLMFLMVLAVSYAASSAVLYAAIRLAGAHPVTLTTVLATGLVLMGVGLVRMVLAAVLGPAGQFMVWAASLAGSVEALHRMCDLSRSSSFVALLVAFGLSTLLAVALAALTGADPGAAARAAAERAAEAERVSARDRIRFRGDDSVFTQPRPWMN